MLIVCNRVALTKHATMSTLSAGTVALGLPAVADVSKIKSGESDPLLSVFEPAWRLCVECPAWFASQRIRAPPVFPVL